jgi:hypothetical protein
MSGQRRSRRYRRVPPDGPRLAPLRLRYLASAAGPPVEWHRVAVRPTRLRQRSPRVVCAKQSLASATTTKRTASPRQFMARIDVGQVRPNVHPIARCVIAGAVSDGCARSGVRVAKGPPICGQSAMTLPLCGRALGPIVDHFAEAWFAGERSRSSASVRSNRGPHGRDVASL